MGDVGIESTLVLDGLAVGKVRFYSTLNSDVGKRIEITDKFNPLNVFTGTFDASLNLLYDLPAFTSYEVKMYGLDGETVESDQTFMLKGYDYLEKNVGLNKNSFAGIKAIVDQGLEDSMIEIGHEFSEDDNVGDGGGRWIVVAKDVDPEYRHSVYLARKYSFNMQFTMYPGHGNGTYLWNINPARTYFNGAYYEALPGGIKNSITSRKTTSYTFSSQSSATAAGGRLVVHDMVWAPSYVERCGATVGPNASGDSRYPSYPCDYEKADKSQFPYYAQHPNAECRPKNQAAGPNLLLISNFTAPGLPASYRIWGVVTWNGGKATWYDNASTSTQQSAQPFMMVASDPIE